MNSTEQEPSIVPWDELSQPERERFAQMLNRRYGASVTVEEAQEYYGNREKVEEDFGEDDRNPENAPECPKCFTPLHRSDIPHLKKYGTCPNCGEVLLS